VEAWLAADRTVTAPAAPAEHLPPAIAQSFRRQTVPLFRGTFTPPARNTRPLTADEMGTIKAAKLNLVLFGADAGEAYRNKSILLNGRRLAQAPVSPEDSWKAVTVDLKADQLALLKLENVLEVTNCGGDFFKFTGAALVVQLPDGTWVESTLDDTVHCSSPGWAYTEGRIFKDEKSEPIKLTFTR
jgi:hypothetical protein